MKRRIPVIAAAAVLAAVPAVALVARGGDDGEAQAKPARANVVAKDHAKDNPAAAVARVTLSNFGKVTFRVTANPKDVKVDWGATSRCVKGPLIDYWPAPGKFKTTTKKAGFGGRYPVPLADPDFCTFAVAANTDTVGLGKGVTVKIMNGG
jgi:hypothetical protein